MIGPEIEMGEQTGPGNEHKTIFVSSAALLGQGIVLLPLLFEDVLPKRELPESALNGDGR